MGYPDCGSRFNRVPYGSNNTVTVFPEKILKILSLTPFASIQDLPLRIYSGNIAGREMLWRILIQIIWTVVLVLTGRLWMAKALKKVVVQGG